MPTSHTSETNIYPSLYYDDAVAAIEWLCTAFGFTKRMVVPGQNGTVVHAELSMGPGVIMVGSSRPERGCVSPRRLPATSHGVCIHVDDPDAHCAHAKACGVTITRELRDEEYGSRGYMAKELEGHSWYFGNYRPGVYWTEDATAAEIEKR